MSDLTLLLLESHRHFWAGNASPNIVLVRVAVYNGDDSRRKLVRIFLAFVDMINIEIEIAHTTQP